MENLPAASVLHPGARQSGTVIQRSVGESDPFTLEDFREQHGINDRLLDIAASMAGGPKLLTSNDVDFLAGHAGKILDLGTRTSHISVPVRAVNVSGGTSDGLQIGYYDHQNDVIRQISLPDAFVDPNNWDDYD